MVGFSILMLMLGALLAAAPQAWHHLNAPEGEKDRAPDDRSLGRIRRNGVLILIAAAALLLLQAFKEAGV